MNYPVLVLGAGGHARVLLRLLIDSSVKVLGITDPDVRKHGSRILGVPVIGDDDKVTEYPFETVQLVNGLGGSAAMDKRIQLFRRFKNLNYSFASLVHPSAVIASDVTLSEGVQVLPGGIIQTGTVIGADTIVNTRVSVDHDCLIGSHVHLAPGAVLCGQVQVGDGAFIGAGATVIQGVRIGRNSVVGAGAVVLCDVPEAVTVVGVPARSIR